MLTLFPLVKYTHIILHVFGTSYSITLETSCFYSKASPLKFIQLFAMLHVLGGCDNFDNTRLRPVQTTLHVFSMLSHETMLLKYFVQWMSTLTPDRTLRSTTLIIITKPAPVIRLKISSCTCTFHRSFSLIQSLMGFTVTS